jgi:hypothetical protein
MSAMLFSLEERSLAEVAKMLDLPEGTCAFLLPFHAATTVGAGTTSALLTYILLTTVRNSFEDMEQGEQ